MGFWSVAWVLNAISWASRITFFKLSKKKRCKYTKTPIVFTLFVTKYFCCKIYCKLKCRTQMLFSFYFCLLCSRNLLIKIIDWKEIFSITEVLLHLTRCHTKTQIPDEPIFHIEVVLKAHCALLQCKSLCISSNCSCFVFLFEPITWGNWHSCSGPHYACLFDL